MIEIKHARELSEEQVRKELSRLFVEGFGEPLKVFSKDSKQLMAAFEHMFNLDVFYVALIDGEVAGMLACRDNSTYPVYPKRKELNKYLGLFKSLMANFIFHREFHKPLAKMGTSIANLEFVATSPTFRGRGVATALMEHVISRGHYMEYLLDVEDKNHSAIKVYERIGFQEFKRVKHPYAKHTESDYIVYMSLAMTRGK